MHINLATAVLHPTDAQPQAATERPRAAPNPSPQPPPATTPPNYAYSYAGFTGRHARQTALSTTAAVPALPIPAIPNEIVQMGGARVA